MADEQVAESLDSTNVVKHGADPTGTAASVLAFGSAKAVAKSAGGRAVEFPSGRFIGPFTIGIADNAVSIEGAGTLATALINPASNTSACVIVGDPTGASGGARGAKLSNFSVIGGGGGSAQHGIHVRNVYDGIRIEDVRIGDPTQPPPTHRGPGGHGFYGVDLISASINRLNVQYAGGDGIHLLVDSQYGGVNACTVSNVKSRENTGAGFRLASSSGAGASYHLKIIGGTFESNTGPGISIENTALNVEINGPHCENNGQPNYLGAYMGTLRNISSISTGWTIAGVTTLVDSCSFSASAPLRIASTAKNVHFLHCTYDGVLTDCIIDESGGNAIITYTNLRPLTGNQDTGYSSVPRQRNGIIATASAFTRGMIARIHGDGSYHDRLLFGAQNEGFPVSYSWQDIAPIVRAGAISDSSFPAGPTPAVGSWGFDSTNGDIYVKASNGWHKHTPNT